MTEAVDGVTCGFCGKGSDEVLHLTRGPESAICDECVDRCIESQAQAGVIPDLRPLHKLYLFNPYFLTENDVRGELNLYEAEALEGDGEREALITEVCERIRKDELVKMLAQSLEYRMTEIFFRVAEENGIAEQLRFAGYVGEGTERASPGSDMEMP